MPGPFPPPVPSPRPARPGALPTGPSDAHRAALADRSVHGLRSASAHRSAPVVRVPAHPCHRTSGGAA